MDGPVLARTHKPHTALEALARGSPAYKKKLYAKAFHHVKRCREAILAKARGGDFGGTTRRELQRVIDTEIEAMDVEDWCDGGGCGESFADFPESAYEEYEEFLYSLLEQLQRDEQQQQEAEHYAEFEQFDEEALLDAVAHLTLEPMDCCE